jgi:hypothetical protein
VLVSGEESLPSTSLPVLTLSKAGRIPQHQLPVKLKDADPGEGLWSNQSLRSFALRTGTDDEETCNCWSNSRLRFGRADNWPHASYPGFLISASDVPKLCPVLADAEVELFLFAESLEGSSDF